MPSIPAIPKDAKDIDDHEAWGKLGNLLVQFIEQCFLAPSLKFNKFLCSFIVKDQPISEFATALSQDERPKGIANFKTQDGVVCT